MANPVTTIYQRLQHIFSGDNIKPENATTNVNTTVGQTNVIDTASSKEEYDMKLLQAKQQSLLAKQWIKAKNDLTNKTLSGLNDVRLMYRDSELMDAFPEIGTALDLYSEECCFLGDTGFMVNITSKSDRIKSILTDLFVNRLSINTVLPMICRAMCKYGNNYMLLNLDKDNGILGWKQLPVYEMERYENGTAYPYMAAPHASLNNINEYQAKDDTKFVWVGQTEYIPYRSWQIAHFRLLYDSQFLPYGCLVGDTRIETEYGYKEIADINVGDKVWTFNIQTQERELADVTKTMCKGLKKVYKLRTKHYEIEATEDHKFLTSDKNTFQYKELKDITINDYIVCDNLQNRKNKITYLEEKPNLCLPSYINEEFARLIGFLIGDGWVSHGNHTMFAMGEHNAINQTYIDILTKYTNKKPSFFKNTASDKKLKYHTVSFTTKDFVELLTSVGFSGKSYSKRIPQWVFNGTNTIKKSFLKGLIDADGSYTIISKNCLRLTLELCNEQLIKDTKTLIHSLGYKVGNIGCRNRIGHVSKYHNITSQHKSYYISFYECHNKQEKTNDFNNRLTDCFKLEKVRNIKELDTQLTYDITVSNDNANFFANGIVTHNCSLLHKARRHFRMLSMMEDMMLVYRLDRSIERRVFKINVGAIDVQDVPAYVQEIANNFKRTPIIDPTTGQIDLRKNIMPVWKKTPIPLSDGRTITIEDLAKESESGKENHVYSVQNKTLEVVLGNVVWCGKNYTAEQMIKITLDNNTFAVMAAEHEVMLNNGEKKRADELDKGDVVMPFFNKANIVETDLKVVSTEYIEGDDVYCMTVQGDNGEDDRHNFALRTFNADYSWNDNGMFVSNCQTEDFFIPTRDDNAPSPIETLPAGQNLTAMDDIQYIQNKVLTALRVPRSFLNFEEEKGDGKNLSLMDVRFTRTVNRIQQALLMELNKIAMIHLFLLGFNDELTDFNLTMNNPSSQAEMLELENLAKKITTAKDAVADPGGGIPLTSMTWAWKHIMKWSDKEIQQNLEELRLESALAAEIANTNQIIQRTHIFDPVDNLYGEAGAEYAENPQEGGMDGDKLSGFGGGGIGGGPIGAGDMDFGDEGDMGDTMDMGAEGEMGMPMAAANDNAIPPMNDNVIRKLNILTEAKKQDYKAQMLNKSKHYADILCERLTQKTIEKETNKHQDLSDKVLLINEEMTHMIDHLKDYSTDTEAD